MAQVTEKTVTVKVKKHPREMFYKGRQTNDHLNGMMRYMSDTGKKDFPDLDGVGEFLKTVCAGDFVGVEHNQYRVEETSEHSFVGVNIDTKATVVVGAEDLTMGLGTGFCEILYRDGKPYGIETEKQIKVKITDYTKQTDPTP